MPTERKTGAATATVERPAAQTQQRQAMTSTKTIFQGQQIANDVRLDILGPSRVALLYKPFGGGDWQTMELDPIVQFAIYAHAEQCGSLPNGLGQVTDGNATRPSAAQKVTGRTALQRT